MRVVSSKAIYWNKIFLVAHKLFSLSHGVKLDKIAQFHKYTNALRENQKIYGDYEQEKSRERNIKYRRNAHALNEKREWNRTHEWHSSTHNRQEKYHHIYDLIYFLCLKFSSFCGNVISLQYFSNIFIFSLNGSPRQTIFLSYSNKSMHSQLHPTRFSRWCSALKDFFYIAIRKALSYRDVQSTWNSFNYFSPSTFSLFTLRLNNVIGENWNDSIIDIFFWLYREFLLSISSFLMDC